MRFICEMTYEQIAERAAQHGHTVEIVLHDIAAIGREWWPHSAVIRVQDSRCAIAADNARQAWTLARKAAEIAEVQS